MVRYLKEVDFSRFNNDFNDLGVDWEDECWTKFCDAVLTRPYDEEGKEKLINKDQIKLYRWFGDVLVEHNANGEIFVTYKFDDGLETHRQEPIKFKDIKEFLTSKKGGSFKNLYFGKEGEDYILKEMEY